MCCWVWGKLKSWSFDVTLRIYFEWLVELYAKLEFIERIYPMSHAKGFFSQQSLHRGSHGSSSGDVRSDKEQQQQQQHHRDARDPSNRPRAGSESRNPVSKVMNLIRHRSTSAIGSEEKRKAVSIYIAIFLLFSVIIPSFFFALFSTLKNPSLSLDGCHYYISD